MCRCAIGHKETLPSQARLDLLDEPSEAGGVQFWQEGRKTLAREGTQGQVQVGAFVAYLYGGDGAVAHRRPFVAQLGACASPQLVMEEHGVIGELCPELPEVFLKSSTAPGFWRTLTGLPFFLLTFSRLQRSLMPPMVYWTPRLPSK